MTQDTRLRDTGPAHSLVSHSPVSRVCINSFCPTTYSTISSNPFR